MPRPFVLIFALALFLLIEEAAAAAWTWPVAGEVVTAYSYGGDPYRGGQHRGIDVAAPAGAPVVAAAGGTVRFAGVAGSSGLTVSLRTADGRFDTSYLHLSEIEVEAGQSVAAGERIGAIGTTGARSTAASHLHFGVRLAGTPHAYRDPLALLPPAPAPPRGIPIAILRPIPARRAPARPRWRPAPVPARDGRPDIALAAACAGLILAVGCCASSIGRACRTTSQRRSTTSTASRISATSTRRSRATCSPGTCASAATMSSS